MTTRIRIRSQMSVSDQKGPDSTGGFATRLVQRAHYICEGWRVEFRPCELQFSEFENAATASLIVLLTRAILSYKWNLLIPISLVDENMKRCQVRDAVLTQRFYWRYRTEHGVNNVHHLCMV
jgi:hypothetical protein